MFKLWEIQPDSTIEFVLKIQNVAGVGALKWSKKRFDHLYSCSLTMDNILSVWNINSIYHPQFIFRGHKETITDFVFNEQDGYVITSSKDSTVMLHKFNDAHYYYNYTNKSPLNFDKENNLAFRTEYHEKKQLFQDLKENKNPEAHCIYNLKDKFLTPIFMINCKNENFNINIGEKK